MKKILKKLLILSIVFMILTLIYARFIEPKLLFVKDEIISSPYIDKSFNGFKIIQFADTHLGDFYSLEDLEKLVIKINDQKPDLVIFTGDLIDNSSTYDKTKSIAPILNKIQASKGKFAVYGNHDLGGAGAKVYDDIMKKSGFKLLSNSKTSISLERGKKISLFGLDDFMLGNPNISSTFKDLNKDDYNILLVHEPDVADRLTDYNIDLQISGHSHGGQVRLPFYGPIISPPYAKNYNVSHYTVNENSRPYELYVNTGIGNTKNPFRFMNPPNITVITLNNK
ncbi:hypothetical protein SAMN02745163_01045 [Clostridium cavendishii DSM 21758]|uniref:Calcineurin-like phosphoesterase domain-containing protein n=1 Tax=Clostridium cavendishii DSM 21758 TaxID=1121302 RepID=A0A1M6F625_9CLOT|nr:metallophosphoesterase [Clostridium cavendishii]SHI93116.1 hypothetical protein SAMN02745163_01045 [Clostridium cavendishii DSM 21758]